MSRITSKDIAWTTSNTICFVCRKPVKDIRCITFCENINNKSVMFKDIKAFKAITICIKCWEEAAGEDYCFSEE